MSQWDVVTFGEPLVNFVADEVGPLHEVSHFTRSLGGAETNVAVGLSRLSQKTALITQLGVDVLGDYTEAVLRQEGVDLTLVSRSESATTGYQFKTKVHSGDPEIHYFRRGSAASRCVWTDKVDLAIASSAHVHLTGIPLALSESSRDLSMRMLRQAKSIGVPVTFDPNLRPSLWASEDEMVGIVNEWAAQADVVLPGLGEGRVLTGFDSPEDIAKFYLDKGVRLVVIKLGPEGAYYETTTDKGFVDGFQVTKVVDTVGAGDGFAVGVIDGLLRHLSVPEAVKQGCAVGAMAVMSEGDNDGLPNRFALDAFMNSNMRRMSNVE